MRSERTIALYSLSDREALQRVRRFAESADRPCLELDAHDAVRALLNRSFPAALVLDAETDPEGVLDLCREFKGDSFTAIVAKVLYKLMAYKDEYEVARLYSRPEFLEALADQFEGDFELRFNLAPPLLSKKDPSTGRPVKALPSVRNP